MVEQLGQLIDRLGYEMMHKVEVYEVCLESIQPFNIKQKSSLPGTMVP
jgi:hypothetical protein